MRAIKAVLGIKFSSLYFLIICYVEATTHDLVKQSTVKTPNQIDQLLSSILLLKQHTLLCFYVNTKYKMKLLLHHNDSANRANL